MVCAFQLLIAVLALFALSTFAAADSSCAGENCRAGDETAFVQYTREVSRAKESQIVQALLEQAMTNQGEMEKNWPGMKDALGNLIKVVASGMVNADNCDKAVNMTKPMLVVFNAGLKTCSEQLDVYAKETLQTQDEYLEKLHNTSGTVSEYLENFGELVNAALDAKGKGKNVVGKLLMPMVMKSMGGLDKAGYGDVADLLNDTIFEDGIAWILRKSSTKVAKLKTITDAEATALVKDVNTTLEATLERFDTLSEVMKLSLDGLTGGISEMLEGHFPPECESLIVDPLTSVNTTKDEIIDKMDFVVDKMVSNVRDGMRTVSGVLSATP